MRMLIFDDGRHDLAPMTDLRAVFEVRTGILTIADRIERTRREPLGALWVVERLRRLVAERSRVAVNPPLEEGERYLVVNGRWLNPAPDLAAEPNTAFVHRDTGDLVMGALRGADAVHFLITGSLPDDVHVEPIDGVDLLTHPWEVIRHRDAAIASDARVARIVDAQIAPPGVHVIGTHPIEIAKSSHVFPTAVLDTTLGPVLVDANAVVRPGAILCGPCYVGRGSTVVDRAHIKSGTAIGPVCKVGGEVGGTIFQGFSNKAHEGHLGDSWIGEWVNVGAGTCNSNLLNTYGEVVMKPRPDGPRHRTGLTFLGAIVGDHVKIAILSRLMTGSVYGTGAMIAVTAPPPATVPAFAWLTDDGERVFRIEKFFDVARAMMARRGVTLSPACEHVLRSLMPDRPMSAPATSP